MNTNQLRTFVAVADMGGIRAAASRLGRTPSAVSMALKQLEDELGASVFEGERKTRLTRFGEFVCDQARSLLEHQERVYSAISAYARNSVGNVDVAVLPSVALAFLPQTLALMQAEAPTIAINARDLDSGAVQEAVSREVVEIGVAGYHLAADIHAEALFSEPLNLVCREDDPLCHVEGPIPWKLVAARNFISNGSHEALTTPAFLQILERHTLHVRNVISLVAVVRAGVGITVLPRLTHTLASDGLRFLPIDDPNAIRTVYLLSRSDRNLSPAARRFVGVFKRVVAEVAAGYELALLDVVKPEAGAADPNARREAKGRPTGNL